MTHEPHAEASGHAFRVVKTLGHLTRRSGTSSPVYRDVEVETYLVRFEGLRPRSSSYRAKSLTYEGLVEDPKGALMRVPVELSVLWGQPPPRSFATLIPHIPR